MEQLPLPLIPRSYVPSNHDVTPVIRQAFQEILSTATYLERIAKNLQKFNVSSEQLKINAVETTEVSSTALIF